MPHSVTAPNDWIEVDSCRNMVPSLQVQDYFVVIARTRTMLRTPLPARPTCLHQPWQAHSGELDRLILVRRSETGLRIEVVRPRLIARYSDVESGGCRSGYLFRPKLCGDYSCDSSGRGQKQRGDQSSVSLFDSPARSTLSTLPRAPKMHPVLCYTRYTYTSIPIIAQNSSRSRESKTESPPSLNKKRKAQP